MEKQIQKLIVEMKDRMDFIERQKVNENLSEYGMGNADGKINELERTIEALRVLVKAQLDFNRNNF